MLRDPAQREQAFRLILGLYKDRLYRLVYRMTGSHEDTDDVLQDALIKVVLHADRFEGKSSLFTWLYRITVNETLSFLEKRSRRMKVLRPEEGSPQAAASDGPSAARLERLLDEAVAGLPDKQRLVFQLRYHEELGYREMAEILDTSEGSLKASFHHAVKKVGRHLERSDLF